MIPQQWRNDVFYEGVRPFYAATNGRNCMVPFVEGRAFPVFDKTKLRGKHG